MGRLPARRVQSEKLDFPQIFTLESLTTLILTNHGITHVPPEIERLQNLRELHLSSNLRLETVSDKVAAIPNMRG